MLGDSNSDQFDQALQLANSGAAESANVDTGSSGSGSSVDGNAVVADAKKYLGIPYLWGGTDPSKGLDCSGLVQRVFADLGVSLPRTTYDQVNSGQQVASLADAQPGDLLFFDGNPPEHVGIYVGNGQMLDAPHTGAQVRVENVWTDQLTTIRRIVPGGTTDTGSTDTGSTDTGTAAQTAHVSGLGGSAASPYASAIQAASAKYGVSADLLTALAQVESGFDPNAVSPAGAQGLMQLMPSTAKSLGVNALDPTQAIDGAARLMSGYLKQFGGSVDEAVAAYNAGPGAVTRYGGVPPYAETQGEVAKVKALLGEVRA
jgi:hypothetical protein